MRHETIVPRDIGKQAGDAATFEISGVYLRRLADSTPVLTLNFSASKRLAIYGDEAEPLLRAWGADFMSWLGRSVQIRLRRAPQELRGFTHSAFESPFAVEPAQDGEGVTV